MASEVDICNTALGHLGDEASVSAISPPDGSAQASHCQRFYPIVRDALLEMHNWRFAIRRKNLTVVDTSAFVTPVEWSYAYAYPNCLKVIAVYPSDTNVSSLSSMIFDQTEFLNRPQSQPFTIESVDDGSQVIYTNVENASVLYIASVTDTSKFSPLFITAFARLLAAYLAGPIIKGEAGMKVAAAQLKMFETIDGMRARVSDAQAGLNKSYDQFVPSSLMARR